MTERRCKRDTLPGNVKRSAMINRSTDNGQTDRHIDAVLETNEFHRSVTLVVIHADDGVMSVVVDGLVEHRICGMRPSHNVTPRVRSVDRGLD